MSPVFDPIVRLALALNSSKGAYAVLLGSGVSAAAGIPTGRQIVADLISRVARLEGTTAGEDAFGWYRSRYNAEPDYSALLDELAASPTERSELLRRYFEPDSDQRRRGVLVPSAGHLALGRLAAQGYISVFLTTNFDRLLEQALEAAGVAPTVLSTPDSLEGMVPLGRSRCTVIKLHGDYLDTRIKNTPEELDSYHPSVDKLLDRVLDEYGLIVCGWSAEWDTALRRAFERCPSQRYTTFWASRSPLTGMAARVADLRQAERISIKDADTLFTELSARLAALAPDTAPSLQGSGSSALNLPARAAAFIGRDAELHDVEERLRTGAARLLTLLGPGGTGKTTLAIRAAGNVAGAFRGGAAFIDLASARSTDDVLVAIARTIGLEEAAQRPLRDVLVEHLKPRHMLLVLDNFEQVTEAADLVAELLAACPKLSMLVTSREALHLRGEQLFPVPPLMLPPDDERQFTASALESSEAVQLFLDRARAVRPDFQLTDENAATIVEICRRLDGLPLAIELAAARLRLLSPEALQDQLRNRLNLLRSGPRDLPERQQTLRAAMNWSYDLLTSAEQRLFELLSVFSGARLDSVEAIAREVLPEPDEIDVFEGLSSLIEKSLIRRLDQGSEPRVTMLETIHEFAADRLDQNPELAARTRQAHAAYFADVVQRLHPDLASSRRLAAFDAMVADIDNLHAAWVYWVAAGDLAQLEKLARGGLMLNESRGWYLATVELTTDMLNVLDRTASTPVRAGQEVALRTSLARALMASKGYTPQVEEAFARSIELFERGTDARQQFTTLRGLANLYNLRGEAGRGSQIGYELTALAEREGDAAMRVEGKLLTGTPKMFIGDLQGGLRDLDDAIALFPSVPLHAYSARAGGNDPRVACYTTSAITLWLLGYADSAVDRANSALSLAAELGHPFTIAYAHFHSGLLHLWRRDFAIVLERMNGLLDIAEEHGFQVWNAAGRVLLGGAQAGLGIEEGLPNMRAGIDLYQGLRSPPVFWPILLSIQAATLMRAGHPGDGLNPLDTALDIVKPVGGTTLWPEYQLLRGDMLLAAPAQAATMAADCYRAALDRAEGLGARTAALRARTRLCRHFGTAGNRDALETLVATFTEGFGTLDLIEAQEVLDQRS